MKTYVRIVNRNSSQYNEAKEALDALRTQRDAMRLELLRAKAMNRADSLFTTDSLMLRVVKYYQRHGSRNERMLSLYLLGCT